MDATRARFEATPPIQQTTGYRVRVARTLAHLDAAAALRAKAFKRRQPELAQVLTRPEAADFHSGNVVLMAMRKAQGEDQAAIVGTVRVQTNLVAPLEYETHLELPPEYRGKVLAICSRLAVDAGSESAEVTRLLFKAVYAYCMATQVWRILITAQPPRERIYETLGFREIYPGRLFRTESTPHYACKLLYLDFNQSWEYISKHNTPFYRMLQEYSPDIELFSASVNGEWNSPRRTDPQSKPSPLPPG